MTDSLKIIENGYVVTCDPLHRAGMYTLLIRNDRIIEVGLRPEMLKSLYPQAEVIDARGKVVLPGFVDAHYHGESHALRLLTAAHPFARWSKEPSVRRGFAYVRESMVPDDLSKMYRGAYFAALKSGVTTLAEYGMANGELSFSAAFDAMRRADIRGFIGIHTGDQLDRSRNLRHHSIRYVLMLPEEDDVTTYSFQSVLRNSRDLQWTAGAHFGETRRGFETLKRNFHKSIVHLLREYGFFEVPFQLLHTACFEEEDIAILAEAGIPLILGPRSVLQKQTDLPPLENLYAAGIAPVVASDWGPAMPMESLRSLCTTIKLTGGTVPEPNALLDSVTIGAARALGMHQEVGSLEPGKKADVVFLDLADIRSLRSGGILPPATLLTHIIQDASSHQVTDVMINGEFYVRQRNIMTYAEEDLAREAEELTRKILNAAGMPAAPVPAPSPTSASDLIPEDLGTEEEGFRIVRKDPSDRTATILPLPPNPPRAPEVSKEVKRVFGDDDIG